MSLTLPPLKLSTGDSTNTYFINLVSKRSKAIPVTDRGGL
jgi:hypothetical protein